MNKLRLTAIATIVITVLALGTAPAALAEGGTSAVVVNARDDSTVYRLMLQIRRAVGDTLDIGNAAVAVASCDSCQTVAVSLQAVLDMSYPSVFVPENIAIAMNVDCDFCQTLATAYQTVLETGGPVHLTPEGNQQIAAIRQELEALRNSGLSLEEIQAQVDQLNFELRQVLLTQLVAAGPADALPAGGSGDAGTASTTAPADTATAPTDTGTSTTPADTGTSTSPSDTGTTTSTNTTPTQTDTGTSTSPSDTGTTTSTTTTTDTGTSTSSSP